MDFKLSEETAAVRQMVARFVDEELIPLEATVTAREMEPQNAGHALIPPADRQRLNAKARTLGLWGIDIPVEYGGSGLGALTKFVIDEELARSITPFTLLPDSPNFYWLRAQGTPDQIERYLMPYAQGEKLSCLAMSEPGAGSDVRAMSTRAVRRGGKWVLNGEKIWISHASSADFMIVLAITDPQQARRGGMTAFIVDRDTPGLSVPHNFDLIYGFGVSSVVLNDVEVDDGQVLGGVGNAFGPMQERMAVRRLGLVALSLGRARRCIEMMIAQAKARVTYGQPLADRQAIQWMIADSYQEYEMVRLIAYRMAQRIDDGEPEVRAETAMVKVQGTEMLGRVADRAIQLFGAMGLSKELPLEMIYRFSRVLRIVDGASEVHRWTIARDLLKSGLPQ